MNIIYKIYISIINKKLYKKIEELEILDNFQTGFRRQKYMITNINIKNTIKYQKKKKKIK